MPSRTRRCARRRASMRRPAKRMAPALGANTPLSRLKAVVLPDPFGPMTAWMAPAGDGLRSRPLTATSPPKRLVSQRVSSSVPLIGAAQAPRRKRPTGERSSSPLGRARSSAATNIEAVEQEIIVLQEAEQLGQEREDDAPTTGAPERVDPPKMTNSTMAIDMLKPNGRGVDEEEMVRVEPAADGRDAGAEAEGHDLDGAHVDAHRGRRLLVLAHGLASRAPARARMRQKNDEATATKIVTVPRLVPIMPRMPPTPPT